MEEEEWPIIKRYLALRKQVGNADGPLFFLTSEGKKMRSDNLLKQLNTVAKEKNLPNFTSTTLRKIAATVSHHRSMVDSHDQGGPREIAEAMAHSLATAKASYRIPMGKSAGLDYAELRRNVSKPDATVFKSTSLQGYHGLIKNRLPPPMEISGDPIDPLHLIQSSSTAVI